MPHRAVQPGRHAVLAPEDQAATALLLLVGAGVRVPPRRGLASVPVLRVLVLLLVLLVVVLEPAVLIRRASSSRRMMMVVAAAAAAANSSRRARWGRPSTASPCCRCRGRCRRRRGGRAQERVMEEARPSPLGRAYVAHPNSRPGGPARSGQKGHMPALPRARRPASNQAVLLLRALGGHRVDRRMPVGMCRCGWVCVNLSK